LEEHFDYLSKPQKVVSGYKKDVLAQNQADLSKAAEEHKPPPVKSVSENAVVYKKYMKLYRGKRSVFSIPLISVESDMGLEALPQLRIGQELVGALATSATNSAFIKLKTKMVNLPEYKFLFNYVFSFPRMLSLLSIYSNLAISKNVENSEHMFNMTKESIKSVFYMLIPGDPWYSKQDERHEALGGNMGMMQKDNNSMTMDGPTSNPSVFWMSVRAALILCKANARQADPNYKLMSTLDKYGIAPFGMTWGSVPILWPSNMLIPFTEIPGWGPPLGPWGIAAYSAALLPGEKKNKKKKATEADCEEQ